jgi:hypothetical protein
MQVVWCSITHGVTPGNLENIHQMNHENHNVLRYPVPFPTPKSINNASDDTWPPANILKFVFIL